MRIHVIGALMVAVALIRPAGLYADPELAEEAAQASGDGNSTGAGSQPGNPDAHAWPRQITTDQYTLYLYAPHVASNALAADFAKIAPDSLASTVLASVAGTPQAQQAPRGGRPELPTRRRPYQPAAPFGTTLGLESRLEVALVQIPDGLLDQLEAAEVIRTFSIRSGTLIRTPTGDDLVRAPLSR